MKKIKKLFSGVICGILFIVIGIGLLWWNEGNNVKNIKTIEEAKAGLVNISSDTVDKANDGKLVSTNGKIEISDEFLQDTMFNVKSPRSIKMLRVVEIYQWDEDSSVKDDETVYTYDRVWSKSLIDSRGFNDKSRVNPTIMPYNQQKYLAKNVILGAFTITDQQKDKFIADKMITLDETSIILPTGYKIQKNYVTNSSNLDTPAIGDVRISFMYVDAMEISVLAKQSGNTFVDYVSDHDKVLNEVAVGIVTGEEMIEQVEKQNDILKIILRFVGIIFIMVGFCGLCSPISNIISLVPLFGKHVSSFINFMASMVGLAVSLVIIAIAWIRFRPIVAICLLSGVVFIAALIIFLIVRSKKKQKARNSDEVFSSTQSEQINQEYYQPEEVNQNLNYASIVDGTAGVAAGQVVEEQVNQYASVQETPASAFERLQQQALKEAEEEAQREEVVEPTGDDIFAQFQSNYIDTTESVEQSSENESTVEQENSVTSVSEVPSEPISTVESSEQEVNNETSNDDQK